MILSVTKALTLSARAARSAGGAKFMSTPPAYHPATLPKRRAGSFDHLVGSREQGLRDHEVETPCGRDVARGTAALDETPACRPSARHRGGDYSAVSALLQQSPRQRNVLAMRNAITVPAQ